MRNHRTSSPPAADKVAFERPLNGDRKGGIGQAYGWSFLEQPIPIVLSVMWLAGAAIIGLGGLAFYSFLLLWRVAGA